MFFFPLLPCLRISVQLYGQCSLVTHRGPSNPDHMKTRAFHRGRMFAHHYRRWPPSYRIDRLAPPLHFLELYRRENRYPTPDRPAVRERPLTYSRPVSRVRVFRWYISAVRRSTTFFIRYFTRGFYTSTVRCLSRAVVCRSLVRPLSAVRNRYLPCWWTFLLSGFCR